MADRDTNCSNGPVMCADSYCGGMCWDNGDSCAHPGHECSLCHGKGEIDAPYWRICPDCAGMGVIADAAQNLYSKDTTQP